MRRKDIREASDLKFLLLLFQLVGMIVKLSYRSKFKMLKNLSFYIFAEQANSEKCILLLKLQS